MTTRQRKRRLLSPQRCSPTSAWSRSSARSARGGSCGSSRTTASAAGPSPRRSAPWRARWRRRRPSSSGQEQTAAAAAAARRRLDQPSPSTRTLPSPRSPGALGRAGATRQGRREKQPPPPPLLAGPVLLRRRSRSRRTPARSRASPVRPSSARRSWSSAGSGAAPRDSTTRSWRRPRSRWRRR